MSERGESIDFWKMHGAGNDFVLVDGRDGRFPCSNAEWIASIARRCTGIGCDGVIVIQESKAADFRMRFFNPDGGEADMCGNGARCVARLAHDLGIVPAEMTLETRAGVIGAKCQEGAVRLAMSEPTGLVVDCPLEVDGERLVYGFVNTGVPHVVVEVPSVSEVHVLKVGSGIRYHERFSPVGTNVNFYSVEEGGCLRIRTYERGVEGETLACGTGIVASALVAAKSGRVTPPVSVVAASGDTLVVDFRLAGDAVLDVTLVGPVTYVYKGSIELPQWKVS